jgi:hypothetical protein
MAFDNHLATIGNLDFQTDVLEHRLRACPSEAQIRRELPNENVLQPGGGFQGRPWRRDQKCAMIDIDG